MAAVRRRFRSGTVILGGMGALAAMLTACGSEPDKRCVDRDRYDMSRGYKMLDSQQCSGSTSRVGSGRAAWYYDGDTDDGWVEDGHFRKGGTSSSVDHGGFGSGHKGSKGS